jgi:hypothetical protein
MKNINFVESSRKMPLMSLPIRTTVVSLSRAKVMISPGSRLKLKDYEEVQNLTHIVAPNLLHCEGLARAHEVYPKAEIWGCSDEVADKAKLQVDRSFNNSPWPFSDELTPIEIRGMPKIKEIVFVHHASKSLIVTDLCFNLVSMSGLGPFLVLSIFGTYQRFGVSRLYLKYVKNQQEFLLSLSQVFAHDFDNIIMSHGDIVLGNGRELLLKAFEKRGFGLR